MYKMMVVDDNKRELGYVKEALDWHRYGVEVAGLFTNPIEALTAVPLLCPDIILTDVAMPRINGFRLVESSLKYNPHLLTIFMSCHDDFQYAKMAVDFNACSYLLKPLIEAELKDAIEKTVARLDKHNKDKSTVEKSLSALREHFMNDLLDNTFESREEIHKQMVLLDMPVNENTQYCIVTLQCRRNHLKTGITSMREQIRSSFAFIPFAWWLIRSPDRIIGMLSFTMEDESRFVDEINGTLSDMIEHSIAEDNTDLFVGISGFEKDPLRIPLLYAQSLKALEANFFAGINPIIWYREICEITDDCMGDDYFNLDLLTTRLRSLWPSGTRADVELFVDNALKQTAAPDEYRVRAVALTIVNLLEMELAAGGLHMDGVFGENAGVWRKIFTADRFFNIRQWLINMVCETIAYQKRESANAERNIASRIIALIRENYAEISTVGEITAKIFFSVSYANRVFKETTGKTIFEYMTEYRIEQAMRLLKQPHCKISAVPELVGYANKSHFALVFKKYVGYAPADYRKRMLDTHEEYLEQL